MSFRQQVNRSRIELFLKNLAARFRQPARIHLVGGTTMVFEGLRQQTLDIDVVFEVESAGRGELIQTVRELKDALSINVEYFQEILPRMGKQSLKQDPVEFEQKFRALEALWQSRHEAAE